MCFFLKSPAGLLIFVVWFQNSCFLRARRVSWPLFLVPKTHAFLQPRRLPDICFWCPKLMFFESPVGFLTFVWCPRLMFFFDSPDICFWCTKLLYRLFESPASFLTFVFGAQNTLFFEIPASFLTFVVGVQNSCFWRAQKVSWHLFWCPKFMYFLKEPGGFPDICFWFQNSCFLRGAQNSSFC